MKARGSAAVIKPKPPACSCTPLPLAPEGPEQHVLQVRRKPDTFLTAAILTIFQPHYHQVWVITGIQSASTLEYVLDPSFGRYSKWGQDTIGITWLI